jgi:hypothetical protein
MQIRNLGNKGNPEVAELFDEKDINMFGVHKTMIETI